MSNEGYSVTDGLLTIRSYVVRDALDRLAGQFTRWAHDVNAELLVSPPLLEVGKLKQIDYFMNFPHLAGPVTTIDTTGFAEGGYEVVGDILPAARLAPARLVVPSSACHGLYFDLAGARLPGTRTIFTYCACHRNETAYEGLQRLRIFTMYEIVCFGSAEVVKSFLVNQRATTLDFARRLGIDVKMEIGNDPFFDPSGAKAASQKAMPTKEEFVAPDGTAIASINYHRNFFGDRCSISNPDGSFVHSGCAAWGLERWLHVLLAMHDRRPEAAVMALERATAPGP
jgi:seryl-tRNA synthetase